MKKMLAIILALGMLMLPVGCSGEVDIEEPEESFEFKLPVSLKEESSSSDTFTEESAEEVSEVSEESVAEVSATEEPSAVEEEAETVLVDGMRPEFKEAMDAYESFYDEYCEFMKKYNDDPTNLKLLADYGKLMTEMVNVNEAFEEWDDGEMNDAELNYYLEVNSRVLQKLASVA